MQTNQIKKKLEKIHSYFSNTDVNIWCRDGFVANGGTVKQWFPSLKKIDKGEFPQKIHEKAQSLLKGKDLDINSSNSVPVVISPPPVKVSVTNIWNRLYKKYKDNPKYKSIRDHILDLDQMKHDKLISGEELKYLQESFPIISLTFDEEISSCMDNVFSIFRESESFNAAELYKETEEKRKTMNLGISTLKERQITYIIDTLQKFLKKFRHGDFFSKQMSELKYIGEIFEQCLEILTEIDGSYTSWDSASEASKFRKNQNNNASSGGNRPDFTVQNYSKYEIFALEVAGSPNHNDKTKLNNDSFKLQRQMQNSMSYIYSKELKMGRPLPKNLQIFGAYTKNFEIIFKKMIRVDDCVLMKTMFIGEVPTTIEEHAKLKDLVRKIIIICVVIAIFNRFKLYS
ncbi:hypothetical protein C2G38_2049295 [Gigaspora rosea]|uniref:Uncharacterized protein n=1 Tax=Gigaspora rosea TaxID=44941 RepID=A0A397U8F7_9GLOM|nr:hypothetical protein C2G38_2049295 [Gigaspora rosea]